MWLAVNEETVTLLDVSSMQSVARVPYSAVVTFGGCQDDLMVVLNNCDIQGPGTQKMLFALPKPKVMIHIAKKNWLKLEPIFLFDLGTDSGTDAAYCRLHERSGLRPAQYSERDADPAGIATLWSEQDKRERQ